jgi:hypothetical protein
MRYFIESRHSSSVWDEVYPEIVIAIYPVTPFNPTSHLYPGKESEREHNIPPSAIYPRLKRT